MEKPVYKPVYRLQITAIANIQDILSAEKLYPAVKNAILFCYPEFKIFSSVNVQLEPCCNELQAKNPASAANSSPRL